MLMKKIGVLCFILVASVLSGCASTANLKAPCPDFGAHCDKAPINSWNSSY